MQAIRAVLRWLFSRADNRMLAAPTVSTVYRTGDGGWFRVGEGPGEGNEREST